MRLGHWMMCLGLAAGLGTAGCKDRNREARTLDPDETTTDERIEVRGREAVGEVKEESREAAEKIRETGSEAWGETKEGARELADETRAGAREAYDETRAAGHDVEVDTRETRAEFVKSSREQLADYDRRIADLETRAEAATGTERARLKAKATELRAQRDDVEDDIDDAERTTDTNWEKVKSGVRTGLDKLKRAFEAAGEELQR